MTLKIKRTKIAKCGMLPFLIVIKFNVLDTF